MTTSQRPNCPDGTPGRPLAELGYRFEERAVLTLSRLFFATFAVPQSQSWMEALHMAETLFGPEQGPRIATAVLNAVQTMRGVRLSVFRFNAPKCACCSGYVTPQEEGFMRVLRATSRGDADAARAHAMLICELGDVTGVVSAFETLVALLATATGSVPASPDAVTPELQVPR